MRALRSLWNLARRRRLDDDLRQELDTHFALIEEEERAGGLSAAEARRAARLRFGNPRAHREQALDGVLARAVEHLAGDLRHAVRMLRKNPSFTLTAVLSLALGIGVNSAMFSVIDAVLVRPLPYARPSRLVVLGQKSQSNLFAITVPEFDVVRHQNGVFASIAAHRDASEHRLEWSGGQDWIETMPVSANFLQTLGTAPVIGRGFDEAEMSPGEPPAVILAYAVWQRNFGGNPGMLRRTVRLDGTPATVVGVLPSSFWLPQHVDALVPLRPTGGREDVGANTAVIARLDDRASLGAAQAFVSSLTDRMREADSDPAMPGLIVQPLHAALVGDVRVHLLLLFGATGLLLLLACVNLAMLLMTRFAARGKEIAVRVALGSGHRRLFAQFLVENLVLAGLGGIAGIAAAYALVSGLVAWIPFNLPAATPIRVDAGVLLFALAVALATALILTFVPLAVAGRLNVQQALRSTNRSASQGEVRGRTRNVLVVAEVALSTMLLVGAGLLIHSLYQLSLQRLGFNPYGVLTFVTPVDRHPSGVDRVNAIRAITQQLERVPGVTEVGAANVLPLAGWRNMPTEHAGHPEQSIGGMEIRAVTPNYFRMLGIPVREGRTFTSSETTGVAMINETLARRWWPGGGALGDRVIVGHFRARRFGNDAPREVIGIVDDAKDRALTAAPSPTVFVPLEQPIEFGPSVAWMIKGNAPSGQIAGRLRAAVADVNPGQRVLQLRTLDDIVGATTATSRFDAALFGILAAVGIVLAAVGLYGLLSFVVAGRRQEIGTRVALGAERSQVFGMFLRQGVALTAIGLAVGIGGALLLTRWLTGLLYEVRPHDPASFLVVTCLLLVIGGLASSVPARRAATLDPADALRAE
jgi:putative ABC transport system permease protein